MNYKTIKLFEKKDAYLTTYILDGESKRGGVLVIPGGAYQHVSPREGEPIAMKFLQAGYNAFVLNYSVSPYTFPEPLLDALEAIKIIVSNQDDWHIDISKIVFCGFSAGGHLAALLALYHTKTNYLKDLPSVLIKPLGLILAYPVITTTKFAHERSFINLLGDKITEKVHFSIEKQVTPNFPKTFLWHTFNDQAVPVENTLLLANSLRENNVPFELHIYPDGVHGLSLSNALTGTSPDLINPHVSKWIDACLDWLNMIMEVNK